MSKTDELEDEEAKAAERKAEGIHELLRARGLERPRKDLGENAKDGGEET